MAKLHACRSLKRARRVLKHASCRPRLHSNPGHPAARLAAGAWTDGRNTRMKSALRCNKTDAREEPVASANPLTGNTIRRRVRRR
jgi:hypothetical protein